MRCMRLQYVGPLPWTPAPLDVASYSYKDVSVPLTTGLQHWTDVQSVHGSR